MSVEKSVMHPPVGSCPSPPRSHRQLPSPLRLLRVVVGRGWKTDSNIGRIRKVDNNVGRGWVVIGADERGVDWAFDEKQNAAGGVMSGAELIVVPN
jgi:hypothetical protein